MFFLTLFPLQFTRLAEKLLKKKISDLVENMLAFFLLSNSVVNPIVYVATDQSFRKELLKICRRVKKQKVEMRNAKKTQTVEMK